MILHVNQRWRLVVTIEVRILNAMPTIPVIVIVEVVVTAAYGHGSRSADYRYLSMAAGHLIGPVVTPAAQLLFLLSL
jgi:hypothetical protein